MCIIDVTMEMHLLSNITPRYFMQSVGKIETSLTVNKMDTVGVIVF